MARDSDYTSGYGCVMSNGDYHPGSALMLYYIELSFVKHS
jgi:hypothetical protein